MFAKVNPRTMTPVNNTIIVAVVVRAARRLRPAGLPARHGVDRHADRVHRGVARRDHPAGARAGPAPRLQGAGLPGDPDPVGRSPASTSCTACTGTPGSRSAAGSAVALVFYFLWSRHHSALNDGGDGVIATAAPGVDDESSAAGRAVTVVVGYLAGKSGHAPLHLAVEAARTLQHLADRRDCRAQAVDDAVARPDRRRIRRLGRPTGAPTRQREAQRVPRDHRRRSRRQLRTR